MDKEQTQALDALNKKLEERGKTLTAQQKAVMIRNPMMMATLLGKTVDPDPMKVDKDFPKTLEDATKEERAAQAAEDKRMEEGVKMLKAKQ